MNCDYITLSVTKQYTDILNQELTTPTLPQYTK